MIAFFDLVQKFVFFIRETSYAFILLLMYKFALYLFDINSFFYSYVCLFSMLFFFDNFVRECRLIVLLLLSCYFDVMYSFYFGFCILMLLFYLNFIAIGCGKLYTLPWNKSAMVLSINLLFFSTFYFFYMVLLFMY